MNMDVEAVVARNVDTVRRAIAAACDRAGRSADEVTLIGVTKSVDRTTADALVKAGVHDLGENRVQDAVAKFGRRSLSPPLPSGVALYMIGNAQTNKARDIVELFDCVHSINRPGIADALNRAASRGSERLPVLLEVNTAGDLQKQGVGVDEVFDLLGYVLSECAALELIGLMTIAPLTDDPNVVRAVFSALRELRDALRRENANLPLPQLSMGMSKDFAIAIEEGATHVRIGRALFAGLPSPIT